MPGTLKDLHAQLATMASHQQQQQDAARVTAAQAVADKNAAAAKAADQPGQA